MLQSPRNECVFAATVAAPLAPTAPPAMSAQRSLSRAVAGSPNRHAGTQDGVYGAASPLPVAGRAFSFRGYALARLRGGANHRCFNSLLTRPDSTALVEAAGRLRKAPPHAGRHGQGLGDLRQGAAVAPLIARTPEH
jgi:hypothetical protein